MTKSKFGAGSFHTIDGLRGVAALMVVSRHVWPLSIYIPESYLAVDLFFLLSGFIIAHAYGAKLEQGNFLGRFAVIRLIRLYPLFLLGTLIGWAYVFLFETPGDDLGVRIAKSMLMISSEVNHPTWTILPELGANLLYALFYRRLTIPVLWAIVSAGAVGLVLCRVSYGTLDAGWAMSQFPVIASRLAFSFFGGILIFKLLDGRRAINPWVANSCVAAIFVALVMRLPHMLTGFYELFAIMVVFPAVVILACQFEPHNGAKHVFKFLGLISYAVYCLHEPVGKFVIMAVFSVVVGGSFL